MRKWTYRYILNNVCVLMLFCSGFFLSPITGNSQTNPEKGLPFITNYSARTYDALPQTWSIQQGNDGVMYFGIQNYLLEYDGVKWRKLKMATAAATVIRSLGKTDQGIIYYGGLGDFGYLAKDSTGQTIPKSLSYLVPAANKNFQDIWSTYTTPTGVYFQSREYIFRIGNKTADGKRSIKVWTPETRFMYAFYLDGDYYVHQQGLGLYKMMKDTLTFVPGSEFLGKERMQVMLPYPDGPAREKQYLVGLFYSGLYIYNGKTFKPLETAADLMLKSGANLYKGVLLGNDQYALATAGKGLIIIDSKGNLLQKINRELGLQDESVYGLFIDKKGTLWLALDNGISRVETSSPITRFGSQSGITTAVISINRFEGGLVIGTTNGVAKFNRKNAHFEAVQGIPLNQIFSLLPDSGQLLVPSDGLYAIRKDKAVKLAASVSGDLALTALFKPSLHNQYLLGGGQSGVSVFERIYPASGPSWRFLGFVKGISEQVWSFGENKDGSIWVGTQSEKVFRITFAFEKNNQLDLSRTVVKSYGKENGLKDVIGQVAPVNGVNYFPADSCLLVFDERSQKFVVDTTVVHIPVGGGSSEFNMVPDSSGRIWIRFGKKIFLAIPKPGGGYTNEETGLNAITEVTIQNIYADNDGIIWFGTTDGLIRYDQNLVKKDELPFATILRRVTAGNSMLAVSGSSPASIPAADNKLRLEYAAPFFEQEEKTRYQTWLEGFEKGYTEFDNNYYKEYTNLPPGDYKFHVRAKNVHGKISEEGLYQFTILPPWYRTWWAFLLYAIVIGSLLYAIVRWRTKKLHEKHRELEKIVTERTYELSQRAGELAVINSVQEGLVKQLDINAIYELTGERIRTVFDAEVLGIATFDYENETEQLHYLIEKGQRHFPGPFPLNAFRKHLILTKEKILVNKDFRDVAASLGVKKVEGTEEPKSALYVPMFIGEKVTGYISLQNIEKENAFSDADVRLLETLANSMGVALENARLFDETNRLLKETEQRTAELAVINSVQDGLAKELDMHAIYELVGERIRNVFDAQAVIIASFDEAGENETFNYAIEKGERFYLQPRQCDKLRQYLIKSRKKILINSNYEQARADFGMQVLPGTEYPKSLLFVPLIIGDRVRSYVSLQNVDKENAFSDADVRLLETLANSMSVALENARLFDETNRLLKETEQRTAELAVINSVQEGLAKELDMQGIYDLVGDRVQKLFNSQGVIIASFDLDNKTEHFNYAFEDGEKLTADSRPINKLRQLLIDKKETIYIDTEERATKEYGLPVIGDSGMSKSMVFVPLLSGNVIKGYVSLQNIDKEHAFSASDIKLLETLANSMSVALENARLFDETNRLLKETEQRTAELAVINSVQDGLAKELDMQGIYDLVGDRVQKLFNSQAVIIASFDLDNKTEHFNYAFEDGKKLTADSRPINKLRELLIDKKETVYIDTEEKARTVYGITAIANTVMPKSLMFVPLLVGNSVKGYVSIQNIEKDNAFSESDIRLLETLANSMSVALENARLFDETNRLLNETEQRTAELAVINSVQEGLAKELDIQGIYELVGDRLCSLFPDTQTLVIRTFDHQKGLEFFHYAIEKGIRFPIDARPFNWSSKELIATKKSLDIPVNYVATAEKHGGTGVTKGQPPKSAVFVPMLVGDIVKGSVSLQNIDKENAFNESDLRLLTTISNSMSVALENARLFEETNRLLGETNQRASELVTVNNISQALASQLDLDQLIKLVGDEMLELFKANIVYLALLDRDTDMISFPYQYGDNMQPLKIGEGLTSKIIKTGKPLLINKDLQELRAQMGVTQIGIPAASYLGVPIPVGDEIIGVLSIQSTEHENRFNENDLRLISTIASSVGAAIRNAQLFEEVKQAKLESEAARGAAEKANLAKSSFLSTVSHELRTPLTSVLGFAKIIKKRLEERIFPLTDASDPKTAKSIQQVTDNLGVVVSEGERLTHLINDVLDLAKIEAGKMEWNIEKVAMGEIAERALAATSSLFENSSIQISKEIDGRLPDILGDRDKLIQVMVNLISNSVKFTPTGAVTCRVFRKKGEVVVEICDTGIGIAPEDHAAVFEQFKQVGDTLTDKPKGTGLGLPICKEIVEHHGGRIWLESKLGEGSKFYFALPISKSVEPKPVHIEDLVRQLKEQVAQSKLNIGDKHAKLLIVDDDDSIRSLLNQELTDAGYIIEEAKNGKEALGRIRANKPDLVILDIMMPEMNGFDVAAILKNDPQTMDIPIIVLSIIQDKTRGFRIGVDRYLTKPIDTNLLFAEIGSLLEQGKSKKKVMIVDEDSAAVSTLTEVLKAKGYMVLESDEKGLYENAIVHQPDIIVMNSMLTGKQDVVTTLRFEKGLENVLFFVYQQQITPPSKKTNE